MKGVARIDCLAGADLLHLQKPSSQFPLKGRCTVKMTCRNLSTSDLDNGDTEPEVARAGTFLTSATFKSSPPLSTSEFVRIIFTVDALYTSSWYGISLVSCTGTRLLPYND